MTTPVSDPQKAQAPVGAAALAAQAGVAVNSVPQAEAPPAPAPQKPAQPGRLLTLQEARDLKGRVIDLLKTVFDPEIPVNIYELGMVYNVSVDLAGGVDVTMTLTSPACPVAGTLPGEVQNKIGTLSGVAQSRVNLVWQPPWSKDMMSEAAKLKLNIA
jgi:FeS assembly SUF system protein